MLGLLLILLMLETVGLVMAAGLLLLIRLVLGRWVALALGAAAAVYLLYLGWDTAVA